MYDVLLLLLPLIMKWTVISPLAWYIVFCFCAVFYCLLRINCI